MTIRIHPERFPYRTVEIFHTTRMNPFRFLQEIDVTASELDILQACNIHLVIYRAHLSWYSAPVGPLAPILYLASLAALNLQLTSLLHPSLPPPWIRQTTYTWL